MSAQSDAIGADGGDPQSVPAWPAPALATERIGLVALRLTLLLLAAFAAADACFAAAGGAGQRLLLEGPAAFALALAGAARPALAARLLRPRGRVVILAVVLALIGITQAGAQPRYDDVEVGLICVAAIVASPACTAGCVAILGCGIIVRGLIAGHALAGAALGELVNQLAAMGLGALLTLGVIAVLRAAIHRAPESLACARAGGSSLTPQLQAALRGRPVGLLERADPVTLIALLSSAERRLVALIAAGLAPKQAAHRLGVSLPTVRTQIAQAKRKTGARTIEQLAGIYAEAQRGS